MKPIVKKITKWTLLIVTLTGCVIAWALWSEESGAPSWRTVKVTLGSITEVVTANGTLNPVELANIGTQVSGQVSQVYVQVNDQVKKGQLLAEIDPQLLETQLKQSRSYLETARNTLEQTARDMERTKMLLEKDYVAKVDLEHAQQSWLSAKNSYESAKTQVEHDQVNLNYTKITSPIDGVVISQLVTLGQTLAASYQTPNMFIIAGDLTKMKIDVNFSESDISKIKVGMPVTFTVDAYPNKSFNGAMQSVTMNPSSKDGVVTYTATVSVENPEKLLFPGMTAYVSVKLSETKDVLRVPAVALRFTPPPEQVGGLHRLLQMGIRHAVIKPPKVDDGEAIIYVLRNHELKPVKVDLGVTDDSLVEISGDGIHEGDLVVTGIMPARKF